MKVLYVANTSSFNTMGGIEYHLLDVARYLSSNHGASVSFAVREGTLIAEKAKEAGFNVYPLKWTGAGKTIGFYQLIRVFREFMPDIISVNRERDIGRCYLLSKIYGAYDREFKPKIVGVYHVFADRKIPFFEKVGKHIFVSEYIKEGLSRKNPVTNENSIVIPNGVHLPEINHELKLNPKRERKFFKGIHYPIIGMVGELRKNQEELVEVAKHLLRKLDKFKIAIVGGGSEQIALKLKEKIAHAGLKEHFILTGKVERTLINDIFFDLDISVSTFRNEGFGIVHLESMASYTPVVAYKAGGQVEVLEKGGSILVEGGPRELAEGIYSLITNQTLRTSKAIEGRKVVEKFYDLEKIGEQHFNLYQSLLKGDGV
ncbi:MAG: glycosyltransferase family 1 protein [Deltaproteobacteria bacterium]|nr:MAG: glycosyltransferase family 1 protein [Deltaproteobacteria bacterium]